MELGKLRWITFILLIAMWVAVIIILRTPEVPQGHGFAHSKFTAMDQGGDGAERHESLLLTGWMFGSVVIAIFVSLLAWGTVCQPGKSDHRTWAFLIGGLLYEGVFAMMCLAYRNSLTDSGVAFLGPFPAGVSWLLFGVWLIPGFFIILYVVFFDRWIMPPESKRKLAQLVSKTLASDKSRDTR